MSAIIQHPVIDQPGGVGLLLWLKRDRPEIYAAVKKQFGVVGRFDELLQEQGLGFDFGSLFSSISSNISSALPAIVSAVKQIAPAAVQAGISYEAAKSQKDLLSAQLKLAQAQQRPLTTGSVISTVQNADGTISQVLSAPRAMSQYGMATSTVPLWAWLAGGGAALLALLLIVRRR